MPLPDTPYGVPSGWTNPASDLTDFVFVIDVSLLPQGWWDEVDTADGARGRLAKDDGTEIASDWVDFDNVAQTGFVFGIWTGTLSSTSNDVPRVYPPKAANASYAATATFGSQAVWVKNSKNVTVHHLEADSNGSVGEFVDSGAGGHNGTGGGGTYDNGAPVQVAGSVGNGQSFDGSNDNIESVGNTFPQTGNLITMMMLFKPEVSGQSSRSMVFGIPRQVGNGTGISGFRWKSSDVLEWDLVDGDVDGNTILGGYEYAFTESLDEWHVIFGVYDGSESILYVNGTRVGAVSKTSWNNGLDVGLGDIIWASTGSNNRRYAGDLDETRIYWDTALSADEVSLTSDNINDPATFWGTWTLEGTGGGTTVGSPQSMNSPASLETLAAAITASGAPLPLESPASLQTITGPITVAGDLQDMLSGAALEAASGIITAGGSPRDLRSVAGLEGLNVQITAAGTLQDLFSAATLDDLTTPGRVSGSPQSLLSQPVLETTSGTLRLSGAPQNLLSQAALAELAGTLIARGTPGDLASPALLQALTASINAAGSPQDLAAGATLDPSTGTLYLTGSPQELLSASILEAVTGIIGGGATKATVAVRPKYNIKTAAGKQYEITITVTPKYFITTNAKPKVN